MGLKRLQEALSFLGRSPLVAVEQAGPLEHAIDDFAPDICYLPRSGQAENLLVELRVEHPYCIGVRATFCYSELPTKIPDGPFFQSASRSQVRALVCCRARKRL
jgi:hypothetical protein